MFESHVQNSKLEVVPIKQTKYCRFSFIGGFPSLLMHVSSCCEEIGEYEMVCNSVIPIRWEKGHMWKVALLAPTRLREFRGIGKDIMWQTNMDG